VFIFYRIRSTGAHVPKAISNTKVTKLVLTVSGYVLFTGWLAQLYSGIPMFAFGTNIHPKFHMLIV
jgi:hypothetical protein